MLLSILIPKRSNFSLLYHKFYQTLCNFNVSVISVPHIGYGRMSMTNIDMLDVIGTVVLTQMVTELIKHAKTFYRAQAEFNVLQASRKHTLIQFFAEPEAFARTAFLVKAMLTLSVSTQEQLEHFTALLNEIGSQNATLSSSVIETSLSQAKITMEQLHQLIQVKILQNVDGTSRARRRAWTRNKSKICSIVDALKEHRQNILTAISANSL
jgi:hypothetical protein